MVLLRTQIVSCRGWHQHAAVPAKRECSVRYCMQSFRRMMRPPVAPGAASRRRFAACAGTRSTQLTHMHEPAAPPASHAGMLLESHACVASLFKYNGVRSL